MKSRVDMSLSHPLTFAAGGSSLDRASHLRSDSALLLAQADAEGDSDVRNELYGQVLEEITAQAADAWLFVLPQLSVLRNGTTGYKVDLPGSLDVTQLAINPR